MEGVLLMMYNKSIGYIIEKMRGDCLTPLGLGTPRESFFKDKDKLLRYKNSTIYFPKIFRDYLKTNTLFKGKWVPNEDMYRTKFYCEPIKGIVYMIGPSDHSAMGTDQADVWFTLRVDGVLYQEMTLINGSKDKMIEFLKNSFGIVWDGEGL